MRNTGPKSELRKENLPASQKEVVRKLIEDYGISHLYSEDMFYKVHKISRADFLAKLEGAKS